MIADGKPGTITRRVGFQSMESGTIRTRQGSTSVALLFVFLTRTFRTDLSKTRKILGFYLSRRAVFAPDGFVNFFSVDHDVAGSIDPQTHLVAADINHGDFDVVADHDRFIALPGQ